MLNILIVFIFGLIWGSFLNVLACRLIRGESLGGRSQCPHCNHQIAWYDNIPLISWIILGGKCRTCQQPISVLYPIIECLTGILFVLLYLKFSVESSSTCPAYTSSSVRPELVEGLCEAWKKVNVDSSIRSFRSLEELVAYFIFFSALIVTIRTDLEHMLISRYVTLFLVPIGITLAAFGLLPISPLESFLSAVGGYLLFFVIAKIFYRITGKEGIGEGDFDLIAFIGSFTGILGLWMTILVGSVMGCIVTILYLLFTGKERSTQIPFGPFLALGAITYILVGEWLMQLIIQKQLL
jgi:leader peptidase (prepilin peptidase)/N-methyltransferase